MKHAVIVFDLDGTLSNPLEGVGRSINLIRRDDRAHIATELVEALSWPA